VLAFIEEARTRGRRVVLVTGADEGHANDVARHLGVFAAVIASNGTHNLTGRRKAASLLEQFGYGAFEYVGNAWSDLPAWRAAAAATVVAGPPRLSVYLREQLDAVSVLVPTRSPLASMALALRPHQWVKNLLLFVPLITSHRLLELELVASTAFAFIAFCCCASAVYVVNDALDIASDRCHPRKRLRPLASGDLSIPAALALAGGLLVTGVSVAALAVSALVGVMLLVYAAASFAYSARIKQLAVADVFLLTSLYVLRIGVGGMASGIAISSWLLTFAMFLFLSLAMMKRYAELAVTAGRMKGRGYTTADADWMRGAGLGAGCTAVLVVALYANAPDVTALYERPGMLMLLCPLLLYWLFHAWLNANRRVSSDDPVVDAIGDPTTGVVVAVGAIVLLAAR
jgi:4-hydroxybenzoate polyprenyltransferase